MRARAVFGLGFEWGGAGLVLGLRLQPRYFLIFQLLLQILLNFGTLSSCSSSVIILALLLLLLVVHSVILYFGLLLAHRLLLVLIEC